MNLQDSNSVALWENSGQEDKAKLPTREYLRIVEDEDDELELSLSNFGERVRIIILYFVHKASRMQYKVHLKAKRTEVEMWACGMVDAKAEKELIMRIESMVGAEEARGVEYEEVILMGEPRANISRPEMWCAEEKMIGEHGVAVGRLDERQVQYLMSRGLMKTEAKSLLMRAKLLQTVNKIRNINNQRRAKAWMKKRDVWIND